MLIIYLYLLLLLPTGSFNYSRPLYTDTPNCTISYPSSKGNKKYIPPWAIVCALLPLLLLTTAMFLGHPSMTMLLLPHAAIFSFGPNLRKLLLLSGDVESNPGPGVGPSYVPKYSSEAVQKKYTENLVETISDSRINDAINLDYNLHDEQVGTLFNDFGLVVRPNTRAAYENHGMCKTLTTYAAMIVDRKTMNLSFLEVAPDFANLEDKRHYCTLLATDASDRARANRVLSLRPNSNRAEEIRDVLNGAISNLMCTRGFQNCRHQSTIGVAKMVHDIDPEQLPSIMSRHGMNFLFITMFLPPQLYAKTPVDEADLGYRLAYNGDKAIMTFYDGEIGYVHHYKTWRKWFQPAFSDGNCIVKVEVSKRMGPVVVLECNRIYGSLTVVRPIGGSDDTVPITIWVNHFSDMLNKANHMFFSMLEGSCYRRWIDNTLESLEKVTVPRKMLDRVFLFNLCREDTAIKRQSSHAYVRAINSKISIGATTIQRETNIPTRLMQPLLTQLFIMGCVLRARDTKFSGIALNALKGSHEGGYWYEFIADAITIALGQEPIKSRNPHAAGQVVEYLCDFSTPKDQTTTASFTVPVKPNEITQRKEGDFVKFVDDDDKCLGHSMSVLIHGNDRYADHYHNIVKGEISEAESLVPGISAFLHVRGNHVEPNISFREYCSHSNRFFITDLECQDVLCVPARPYYASQNAGTAVYEKGFSVASCFSRSMKFRSYLKNYCNGEVSIYKQQSATTIGSRQNGLLDKLPSHEAPRYIFWKSSSASELLNQSAANVNTYKASIHLIALQNTLPTPKVVERTNFSKMFECSKEKFLINQPTIGVLCSAPGNDLQYLFDLSNINEVGITPGIDNTRVHQICESKGVKVFNNFNVTCKACVDLIQSTYVYADLGEDNDTQTCVSTLYAALLALRTKTFVIKWQKGLQSIAERTPGTAQLFDLCLVNRYTIYNLPEVDTTELWITNSKLAASISGTPVHLGPVSDIFKLQLGETKYWTQHEWVKFEHGNNLPADEVELAVFKNPEWRNWEPSAPPSYLMPDAPGPQEVYEQIWKPGMPPKWEDVVARGKATKNFNCGEEDLSEYITSIRTSLKKETIDTGVNTDPIKTATEISTQTDTTKVKLTCDADIQCDIGDSQRNTTIVPGKYVEFGCGTESGNDSDNEELYTQVEEFVKRTLAIENTREDDLSTGEDDFDERLDAILAAPTITPPVRPPRRPKTSQMPSVLTDMAKSMLLPRIEPVQVEEDPVARDESENVMEVESMHEVTEWKQVKQALVITDSKLVSTSHDVYHMDLGANDLVDLVRTVAKRNANDIVFVAPTITASIKEAATKVSKALQRKCYYMAQNKFVCIACQSEAGIRTNNPFHPKVGVTTFKVTEAQCKIANAAFQQELGVMTLPFTQALKTKFTPLTPFEGEVQYVHGVAGSGKTRQAVTELDLGEWVAVSPFKRNLDEFTKGGQFPANSWTFHQAMLKYDGEHNLLVDEAPCFNPYVLAFIVNVALENGRQVILLGDPKQIRGVDANNYYKGLDSSNFYFGSLYGTHSYSVAPEAAKWLRRLKIPITTDGNAKLVMHKPGDTNNITGEAFCVTRQMAAVKNRHGSSKWACLTSTQGTRPEVMHVYLEEQGLPLLKAQQWALLYVALTRATREVHVYASPAFLNKLGYQQPKKHTHNAPSHVGKLTYDVPVVNEPTADAIVNERDTEEEKYKQLQEKNRFIRRDATEARFQFTDVEIKNIEEDFRLRHSQSGKTKRMSHTRGPENKLVFQQLQRLIKDVKQSHKSMELTKSTSVSLPKGQRKTSEKPTSTSPQTIIPKEKRSLIFYRSSPKGTQSQQGAISRQKSLTQSCLTTCQEQVRLCPGSTHMLQTRSYPSSTKQAPTLMTYSQDLRSEVLRRIERSCVSKMTISH
nr:hypothetical protein [Beihai hepe-like virus 4]